MTKFVDPRAAESAQCRKQRLEHTRVRGGRTIKNSFQLIIHNHEVEVSRKEWVSLHVTIEVRVIFTLPIWVYVTGDEAA